MNDERRTTKSIPPAAGVRYFSAFIIPRSDSGFKVPPPPSARYRNSVPPEVANR
jgi:hypothetical protein